MAIQLRPRAAVIPVLRVPTTAEGTHEDRIFTSPNYGPIGQLEHEHDSVFWAFDDATE